VTYGTNDGGLPSEICTQSDPLPLEKCRLQQISTHNVETVRNSEDSSIMTNKKLTTSFPTNYGMRMLPKVPKG